MSRPAPASSRIPCQNMNSANAKPRPARCAPRRAKPSGWPAKPVSGSERHMILVIDNYDSFTWNLVHYLMELGVEVEVVRNDALSAGQAISSGAQGFLISPGPCTPNEAGISLDLVGACADAGKPLLGVCLGHQSIGQYFGGEVVRGGVKHSQGYPLSPYIPPL